MEVPACTSDMPKHFLDMTIEEKLQWRFKKIVDGYLLIALCIEPTVPGIDHVALFAISNRRPRFIEYVTVEMLEDDGYLMGCVLKAFPY